ncbi:MAG: restriction endonuclease subunit S [Stagnimonas sp.]|nr:restriction endonuclease subunit S [Stagnimonas sp.]
MSSKTKASGAKEDGEPVLVPKQRFPEFRDKPEWQLKPFKKLFSIGNGKDYKHLSTGEVPVYGSGGYMLSVDDYLHDGESVCIGRKGTINNPMFLTGKFWTVDTLFYTHSFNDCLPKFIYAIFQSIDWLKHNEAGGVPSLSKANIEKIETAVPRLPEQQKIAECLSSVDGLIAAQARKVDALKTHKKGLMQQLFPREGETQPCLRFPEFQDAGEWVPLSVSQFAKVTTGAKDTQNKVDDGRYPFFVRSQTVERIDSFSFDGEAVLTSGDGVGVGKNFHYINGKFDFHQRVYCIYDFDKSVSGLFFYLYFSEHFGERVMRMSAKNSVDSVRMAMITEMPVVLPSRPEQQCIADCLTSLDDLITAETQKLEALKTHKKGLMQQLFPSPAAVEA